MNVTFGDDGLEASDAAWAWITEQQWSDGNVDIIRAGVHIDQPDAADRFAPRRCQIARVRTIESPLEPRTALLSHSGTDVIVVGARTREVLRSASLGSTVESVLQRSPVSVIVARKGGPVRSVLMCVPGHRPWPAVHSVIGLPWMERAVVEVLCVLTADEETSHAHDSVQRLIESGIRARLLVRRPDPTALAANPKFRIFEELDRLHPDLVIVGAPSTSRITAAVTGSTALEVARYATCSVMLACPPRP